MPSRAGDSRGDHSAVSDVSTAMSPVTSGCVAHIKVSQLDGIPLDYRDHEFRYEIRRPSKRDASPQRSGWRAPATGADSVRWHSSDIGGQPYHTLSEVRAVQVGDPRQGTTLEVAVFASHPSHREEQRLGAVKFKVPPMQDPPKEVSHRFEIMPAGTDRAPPCRLKVALRVQRAGAAAASMLSATTAVPGSRQDMLHKGELPSGAPSPGRQSRSHSVAAQSEAKGSAAESMACSPNQFSPAILAAVDGVQRDSRSEILAWEKSRSYSTDWHPWELYSLFRWFTRNVQTQTGEKLEALELFHIKNFSSKCPCYFHGDAWKTWFRDPMVIECTIDIGQLGHLLQAEAGGGNQLTERKLQAQEHGGGGDEYAEAWVDHKESTLELQAVHEALSYHYGLQVGWELLAWHQTTHEEIARDPTALRGHDDWRDWQGCTRVHADPDPAEGVYIGAAMQELDRLLKTAIDGRFSEGSDVVVQLLLRAPAPDELDAEQEIPTAVPESKLNNKAKWFREDRARSGSPRKDPYTYAKPLRWTVHPDGDVSHDKEEEAMAPVEDENRENAGDGPVRFFGRGAAGYLGYHSDGQLRQSIVLGGPPTKRSKQGEDTWAPGCPICTYIFEPEAHHDQRTRTYGRVPGVGVVHEAWHWPRKKAARLFRALMKKVESARAGRVGKGEHAMTPFEFCKSVFKLMGEARETESGMRVRSGPYLQAQLVFKAFDFDKGGCLDFNELLAMLGSVGGVNSQAAQEEIRTVFDTLARGSGLGGGLEPVFDSERATIHTRPWISKATLTRVFDHVSRYPGSPFAGLVLNLAHVTTYRLMRPANKIANWLSVLPCCGGWDPPVNPLDYPDNIPRPEADPLKWYAHWGWTVEDMEPFTDELPGGDKGPPSAQELYALYVAFKVKTDQEEELTKDAFIDLLLTGTDDRGGVSVNVKEHPGFVLSQTDARDMGFTNEITVHSAHAMTINLRDVWLSRTPKEIYCGFRRNAPPQVADFKGNDGKPHKLFALPNSNATPHGSRMLAATDGEESDDAVSHPAIKRLEQLDRTDEEYLQFHTIAGNPPTQDYIEQHNLYDWSNQFCMDLFSPKGGAAPEFWQTRTADINVAPGDEFSFSLADIHGGVVVARVSPQAPRGMLPSYPDKRVARVIEVGSKRVSSVDEALAELEKESKMQQVKVEFTESLLCCTRCLSGDVHAELRVERLAYLKKDRKKPMVFGVVPGSPTQTRHPDTFDPAQEWTMLGYSWRHLTRTGGLQVTKKQPDSDGPTERPTLKCTEEVWVEMNNKPGQHAPVLHTVELDGRELRAVWLRTTQDLDASARDHTVHPHGAWFTVGPRGSPLCGVDNIRSGEELLDLLTQVATKGRWSDLSFSGKGAVASVVFSFGPQPVQYACDHVHNVLDGILWPDSEQGAEDLSSALEAWRKGRDHAHDLLCSSCYHITLIDDRIIGRGKADALFNRLDSETGDGNGSLSATELLYGVLDGLGKLHHGASELDARRAKQLFVEVFFAHVDDNEDGFLEEKELRSMLEDIVTNYSYADQRDRDHQACEKVKELYDDLMLAWEHPDAVQTRENWDEPKRKRCRANLRQRKLDKELLTLLLTYKEPGKERPKWDFLVPYFAHLVTFSKVREKDLCYFKECTWCCGMCTCGWRESCADGWCKKCNCCITDQCRKVDLEVDDMPDYHCSRAPGGCFSNPSVKCC